MGLGKRSPAPVPQAPPNVRTAPIVAVLAIAVFMSSLDLFIVNLAFPSIAEEYAGVGLGELSWVLNAYTIVFASVLIPAGRWADQVGRRRALVAGLAVFTGGSLLCGLAPGVGWLVAARMVQAVGAGVMVPASMSLLLAVVPAEQRARALGYLGGGRRAGRCPGTGDRWRPGRGGLALGVLGEHAGGDRGGPAGPAPGAGEPGRCTAGSPRCARCAVAGARRRAGRRGPGQGAGLGLAVGGLRGAAGWRLRCARWRWSFARRVTRRRCWSRACSGPGRSPAPVWHRCSTTRPSAPSSCTRWSSSPGCGTTRRCRRGWPSPRGR